MASQRVGRAAIVGAGIVGLSVAWFLQEHGVDVTVMDRQGVAAGASAGNAGWICPSLAVPLPDKSVLRYGAQSLLRAGAPLRIAPLSPPSTWRFLAGFARHCTQAQWLKGAASYIAINALALESYDRMKEGGILAEVIPAPLFVVFETASGAAAFGHEIEALRSLGAELIVTELDERELHREQPALSPSVRYGFRLERQGYVQPSVYTRALGDSVIARGGRIESGTSVVGLDATDEGVRVTTREFSAGFDLVVVANGAWMSSLTKGTGIRTPIGAGRGYSFVVRTANTMSSPLYLPDVRVACTPTLGGMRIAGTMECRSPDARMYERRIRAITRSAERYFDGIDWATISDPWVGPRPVTTDGLPLIGATQVPNVFIAGGHGMWGMTLGPVSGRLLAQQVITGVAPAALHPFDPCR